MRKKKSTQQQLEKKVFINRPLITLKKLILKLKPLVLLHKLLKMALKLLVNLIINDLLKTSKKPEIRPRIKLEKVDFKLP